MAITKPTKNPLVNPSLYTLMESHLNKKMPGPSLPNPRNYDDVTFKAVSSKVDENLKKFKATESMKSEARERHRAKRQGK